MKCDMTAAPGRRAVRSPDDALVSGDIGGMIGVVRVAGVGVVPGLVCCLCAQRRRFCYY